MATQWYQAVHTAKPRFRVGTRKRSMEGCDFVYGTGVTANALGAFVVFNDKTYTPVLLTSATPSTGEVAISMSANLSNVTNQLYPTTSTVNWSWYMVQGSSQLIPALAGKVSSLTGSTNLAALYQSGTAGAVTTTASATKLIVGAWAIGTSASNVGDALLNYPSVAGTSTL